MNVFPDVDFMARRQPLLDDDNQWDVEPRVASLKPEAADVSPPLGSIGRAIWVSTMNLIADVCWLSSSAGGATVTNAPLPPLPPPGWYPDPSGAAVAVRAAGGRLDYPLPVGRSDQLTLHL
jgi:hypothetical protein